MHLMSLNFNLMAKIASPTIVVLRGENDSGRSFEDRERKIN